MAPPEETKPQPTTTFQINPPEQFNFANPDSWVNWIRRFERFRIASGLNNREGENQVNTLVYCMGDDADDILHSFKLSSTQLADYATVKSKFYNYFITRRNVRDKFNKKKIKNLEKVLIHLSRACMP